MELFSSRESSSSPNCSSPSLPCPGPPPPSPDPLARLALAMELSRRVAGLGGPLANLSVEHVHSFLPWVQAHGGWVSHTHPARSLFNPTDILTVDRFSSRTLSSYIQSILCLLSTCCMPDTAKEVGSVALWLEPAIVRIAHTAPQSHPPRRLGWLWSGEWDSRMHRVLIW